MHLRGQFKLAKISVNTDLKGIVRDVRVKVSLSGCVQVRTPKSAAPKTGSEQKDLEGTVLHWEVARLIILIAAEDQVVA